MTTIQELEIELNKIKERNTRVEADKAWERSFFRRAIIAIGTYLFASILFLMINAPTPFLDALVPTCAFILSTLTLPFLKDWWIKKQK